MEDSKQPLLQSKKESFTTTLLNVIRVCLGVLFLFLISFEVAGYQALRPILNDAGIYSSLCPEGETTCTAQTLRLNLMVTCAISAGNMITILVGFIVRWFGDIVTVLIGCLLSTIGSVIFALSNNSFQGIYCIDSCIIELEFTGWILGYILLACSGGFIGFGLFGLPSLFPNRSGLIFSLIIAALDGSAAIFYGFKLIYDNLHISLRNIFLLYSIIPVLLAISTKFILTKPNQKKQEEEETGTIQKPSNWLPNDNLKIIFFSYPFWIVTAWISVYLLTKYFYLANVYDEMLWITKGNKDQASLGSDVFAIMFPLGAIFIPITSWLLDKMGLTTSIAVLAFTTFIFGVCSVIPNAYLQVC
jgi:hypothetical protein